MTCLESLEIQTLGQDLFDIIIIINGEKDSTESLIYEFVKKNKCRIQNYCILQSQVLV